MLEHFVGHHPPELARSGDQDALQADPGFPAALERLAHDLARAEGEHDRQRQVQAPDELRDLVHARVLERVGHVVGVVIQRPAHPEYDGQDAAAEYREEVVHARPAAPQAVEALHVERERDDQPDEGSIRAY